MVFLPLLLPTTFCMISLAQYRLSAYPAVTSASTRLTASAGALVWLAGKAVRRGAA